MAFVTVRKIIRNRSVTVVGSAPLTPQDQDSIAQADIVIAVNGAISSVVGRSPDIWALNTRDYDDDIYTDPSRWPQERKDLHELMLRQGQNRQVRHLLCYMKGNSSQQTLSKLKALGVQWRAQTDMWAGERAMLIRDAGIKPYSLAANLSAGLATAIIALKCRAKEVRLVGFSFGNAYSYIDSVPIDTRKHISQDRDALSQLKYDNLILPPLHFEAALDC